jgi:hypothetical protein
MPVAFIDQQYRGGAGGADQENLGQNAGHGKQIIKEIRGNQVLIQGFTCVQPMWEQLMLPPDATDPPALSAGWARTSRNLRGSLAGIGPGPPAKAGGTGTDRSGSRNLFYARGHAGKFAGHGVSVHHALASRSLHFRLRLAQCGICSFTVPTGDGSFDLFDKIPHAGFARVVPGGADNILPDALARGIGVRHLVSINLALGTSEPDAPGNPAVPEEAGF